MAVLMLVTTFAHVDYICFFITNRIYPLPLHLCIGRYRYDRLSNYLFSSTPTLCTYP